MLIHTAWEPKAKDEVIIVRKYEENKKKFLMYHCTLASARLIN